MRNVLSALAAGLVLAAALPTAALACDGEKAASSAPAAARTSDGKALASASFKVDGMSCAVSCPVAIRTALEELDGVASVTVNFDTKQVEVQYTAGAVTSKQMMDAIVDLGYKAEAIQPAAHTDAKKAES